jgi:hypothetical protein
LLVGTELPFKKANGCVRIFMGYEFFFLDLKTDLQFIGLNNILENILKTRYNHMTCDTVVVFKVWYTNN